MFFFIFRITSEIYYLSRWKEPDTPTVYAMVACAASTATLSVTIVGLIYEAYVNIYAPKHLGLTFILI